MGVSDALLDDIGSDDDDAGADDTGASTEDKGASPEPKPERRSVSSATSPSDDDDDDDDGDGGGKPKPKPSPPAQTAAQKRKFKLRVRGEERELDADDHDALEEHLRQLDDDYEHEWQGPGGQPIKLNRSGIQRAIEQAQGFEQKMRMAHETRQQYEERMGAYRGIVGKDGKVDTDRMLDLLEGDAGVPDMDDWAWQRAQQIHERNMMIQPTIADESGREVPNPHYNPEKYHQLLQERANAKAMRKERVAKMIATQRHQQAQLQQQNQKRYDLMDRAFQKQGVKADDVLHGIAARKLAKYAQMGHQVSAQTLASEATAEYDKMILKRFDAMTTEQKLKFLGDKRRASLREAELQAAKLSKKQQRQQENKSDAKPDDGEPAPRFESIMKALRS